jgi:hypothetical protein
MLTREEIKLMETRDMNFLKAVTECRMTMNVIQILELELYLHSPNTSSCRGAWLSTGTAKGKAVAVLN